MDNISVLILSTLPDTGIKSLGTKSLIKIHSKYFIDYQLDSIQKALKHINHEIIIASSFDYHKTYKILNNYKKYNINIIRQNFDNINYGGAFLDALSKTSHDNVLCINYGCWFNKDAIKNIIADSRTNTIGVIKQKKLEHLPVSCLIKENTIENLFFDISDYHYGEMFFINSETKKLLLDTIPVQPNINRFSFEILNMLIESGVKFQPAMLNNKNFIFLTSNKHFNKFRKLLNEPISKT